MEKLVNLSSDLTNYRKTCGAARGTTDHLKCYMLTVSVTAYWKVSLFMHVKIISTPRNYTLCRLLQWVTTFLQERFKSSYKFSLCQLNSIPDGSSSWGNVWKEQLIKIIYLWSEVVLEIIAKKEKYHWTKYRAKPVILLQSLKDHRNLDITQIDKTRWSYEQHGHKEGSYCTT